MGGNIKNVYLKLLNSTCSDRREPQRRFDERLKTKKKERKKKEEREDIRGYYYYCVCACVVRKDGRARTPPVLA